jgi:two-component system, NtrC family, response regulator GlrR
MAVPSILIRATEDMCGLAQVLSKMLLHRKTYCVTTRIEPVASWDPPRAGEYHLVIPVLIGLSKPPEEIMNELGMSQPHVATLPVISASSVEHVITNKLTAKDFLISPLCEPEVLARVQRVLAIGEKQQVLRVKQDVTEALDLDVLVGNDPAFLALKRKLALVAYVDSPVLLTGETGTGKELCARALHYLSARSAKPFLPVNCGAIPVDLFESELFGRRKGAYTGAGATQQGLIGSAEGGTLFLDEIETLHRDAQAKLLRFLQDRTYYPIGSPVQLRADVRVVASTNVDLHEMVKDGTFRKDLLYRLAVMSVALPALRERPADIPLLVEHFWSQHAAQHPQVRKHFSSQAWLALCQYTWPGNVRELQNVIQQVLVMSDGDVIDDKDLPIPVGDTQSGIGSFKQAKHAAVAEFEKTYLHQLLQLAQGNVSQAARIAQKERRALGRLIRKHQIKPPESSARSSVQTL